MEILKFLFLVRSTCFMILNVNVQENAAPSIHLNYHFPSGDAILKMQKIKIVRSGNASYFEVNWFTNGYTGLQETPDTSFSNPNILISSLWDLNTAGGVYSAVDYYDPSTLISRFGGEGDGWKTINPFNWELNTWYNLVNRAYKSGGRLYIGTYINNLSTGKWFHTATLSIPDPGKYLTGNNDAFMENWDGTNVSWNGTIMRKAFFRDGWNLNTNGKWEKNTKAIFCANDSKDDIIRNGVYHNSFNAYFDGIENAYCMQHGGNTTPSTAFNGGRTIELPAQINQGAEPSLTTAKITSFIVRNIAGKTNFNWTIDECSAPQMSAKVEIIGTLGKIVTTIEHTLPLRNSFSIKTFLSNGIYTARVTVKDIFNQISLPLTKTFSVSGFHE